MTKTPTETTTRRQRALIMAAYTLVLALGAALSVAASYSGSIAQRVRAGELEGGAYRPATDVHDACDESKTAQRPRSTAELTPASLTVSVPELDDATPCSPTHEDPRGS